MPYASDRHGKHRIVGPGFHGKVHQLVGTLPPGCVVTYGDVGAALGSKNVARHVGYFFDKLARNQRQIIGGGGFNACFAEKSAKGQFILGADDGLFPPKRRLGNVGRT